jgi:hypothetical protein
MKKGGSSKELPPFLIGHEALGRFGSALLKIRQAVECIKGCQREQVDLSDFIDKRMRVGERGA